MTRAMRDSGVGWLGGIPADWNVVPSRALFGERKTRSSASDIHLTPSQKYGVLPQSQYMEITGNKVVLNLSGSDNMRHVEPGDYISHLRSFQGGLEHATLTGKVSAAYTVLKPKTPVDGRYFKYLFKSDLYVQALQTTTDQLRDGQSIRFGEFSLIPLPHPPIAEQRAIADFLDRETAQIDAFIAKNEELIALLHERRTAVVDATFARITARLIRLKYVASVQTGITLGGDGDPSDPAWPYLSVANVQVGFLDMANIKRVNLPPERAQRSLLRVGDVLMTEGGDPDKLGRGALWEGSDAPMLHQNHVFAVRTSPQLDPRYLMRWLDASPARRHFESTAKQTTNLASTNKTVVGELKVPLPAVVEQRRITREIDAKLDLLSSSMGVAKRAIDLARERRAALISAAVTGKIDVGVSA